MVIFTDLDGTLLDRRSYSYVEALPALNYIKAQRIPLVFCSAKTRVEQEVYQQQLGLREPFIVENGSALFIPRDYFPFTYPFDKASGNYNVIEFGLPYALIREKLEQLRRERTDLRFSGYGDMTVEQVAAATGLDLESARRAMQREYDETVKCEDLKEKPFQEALQSRDLFCTHGGTFYHVRGNCDKGRAVRRLAVLYRAAWGRIRTIGIGDSLNDQSLLEAVDQPFLVQKLDGTWEQMGIPGIMWIDAIGPQGWNRTILTMLSR